MDKDDFAEARQELQAWMYYQRRERKSEMALVYIIAGWIGLLGGVVGYWVMKWVAG